jgi:hypothetical protein
VDLPIDVSRVSFNGAGSYVQHVGYFAVPKALANQFCYFTLTGRQVVPVLHVRPLLFVEQYYFVLLAARNIASEAAAL